MKSKLKISVALSSALLLTALSFSGCGSKPAASGAGTPTTQPTAQPTAAQPAEPTHDELVAKAKEEGTVVVYSITSRIANAAEAFEKKYGIKVEASNLKDYELIEKISKEASSGVQGADFVICQDSGRVFGELLKPGYLYNYVPSTMKDNIPAQYQDPLVFSMINKVFMYNNETYKEVPLKNIWQLADPEYKGKFFFKNPFQEGVNANFLTMITSDENAKKIADSYKEYYGKEIELTTKNAGYEWIKRVFENGLVLGTSDTTIAENIGVKGQGIDSVGLAVYSKTRYDKSKNLATTGIVDTKPFTGFMYPTYALMVKNAKHPNAAKLFIEYVLTEEGFAPWGVDFGTYSSNKNIKVNEGDHPIDFWEKCLIVEDPEYIFSNRADVEEFVNQFIK